MAETKGNKDIFPQIAYLTCTETAANTLTFAKLDIATGALLGEKKYGMVIKKIQYKLAMTSYAFFNASADSSYAALCVSQNITAIDLESPEVIDVCAMARIDIGAAASGSFRDLVIDRDFTSMGGLLVPADKLYLAVVGVGLTAASNWKVRVWYTMKELSISDYWDLVETRRIIST